MPRREFRTRPYGTEFCELVHHEHAQRSVADVRRRRAYNWAAAAVAGVVAGCLGFGLDWLTEALTYLKFKATALHIRRGGGFFLPWLTFSGISAGYSLIPAVAVAFVCNVAAGSGLPQMRAWVNGVDVPGAVAPLTLLVKAGGVMWAIASGLVVGKEGPFIHSGGILGYLVGMGGSQLVQRWARRRLEQQACKEEQHTSSPAASPQSRGIKEGGADCAAVDDLGAKLGDPPSVAPGSNGGGSGLLPGTEPSPSASHVPTAGLRRRRCAADQSVPAWVPPLVAPDARERSDFASVGTAAGVGIAFLAPVAGMVYAVEEGSTWFSTGMLWKACVAASLSVGVLQILSAAVQFGSSLWSSRLSAPMVFSFQDNQGSWGLYWWYTWEVPFFCLLGVAGGLLGALWSWLTCRLLAFRARHIPASRPVRRVLEVVSVATLTATVWLAVSYGSPCRTLPPADTQESLITSSSTNWLYFSSPSSLFPQMWCADGQYAEWGQLFGMPIDVAVRALFSVHPSGASSQGSPQDALFLFTPATLALFFAAAFVFLCLAYGIAAPTGIFIPTMAIGAAMGRLCGRAVQGVLNGIDANLQVSLPAWSAVGAAALLAGNTRLLLATALIVSETSGCTPVIGLLIIATALGKAVADAIIPEVYAWQEEQAGYAVLEPLDSTKPVQLQRAMRAQAGDVMTREPLATLSPRPRLQQVLDLLRGGTHDYVPVVEEEEEEEEECNRGSIGSKGSSSKCDASGGMAAGHQAEQDTGSRTLVGVLYRWQLVSLLRHPALLRMLACEGSAAGAAGDPPATAEERQPAMAAGPSQEAAQQQQQQAQPGGASLSSEQPAADSAAVSMPAPLVERLSREQRLVMLALLAGSPDEEPLEREAAVLAQYKCDSSSSGGGGGVDECKADAGAAMDAAVGNAAPDERQQQAQQPPLPLDQRLDLSPLLQCHPVTTSSTIAVSHAQLMLRHLGLLGLTVRSGPVRLAGVITRADVRRVQEDEAEGGS